MNAYLFDWLCADQSLIAWTVGSVTVGSVAWKVGNSLVTVGSVVCLDGWFVAWTAG